MFSLFRKGDLKAACYQFPRWVYGGGRVLPGLVDRSLEARRMEAGQNISGAILIVTQFRLTQGQPGTDSAPRLDADIVTYNGRDYRVTFVDPYTSYGAGFVQAHCELVDFNGGTPVE